MYNNCTRRYLIPIHLQICPFNFNKIKNHENIPFHSPKGKGMRLSLVAKLGGVDITLDSKTSIASAVLGRSHRPQCRHIGCWWHWRWWGQLWFKTWGRAPKHWFLAARLRVTNGKSTPNLKETSCKG